MRAAGSVCPIDELCFQPFFRFCIGPTQTDAVIHTKGFCPRMQGRSQADLARLFGSRSRASEVLNRRRHLSADMIARLADAWGIARAFPRLKARSDISASRSTTRSRSRRRSISERLTHCLRYRTWSAALPASPISATPWQLMGQFDEVQRTIS